MIFSLLTLPLDGFKFIMNTLVKVAEEQWTDDAPLKQQLLELQVLLENGDITEDEYVEAEGKILLHLREIQERKRELAGAEPRNEEGLSGTVQEGSGASVTLGHHSENDR
ncbi:MAG TPA: gas vesicle protein GvpG [Terriglobales bacterium]|nr:gas vesicle protein GvpG [Terriglobales bacterium]